MDTRLMDWEEDIYGLNHNQKSIIYRSYKITIFSDKEKTEWEFYLNDTDEAEYTGYDSEKDAMDSAIKEVDNLVKKVKDYE